jgi:hexosaminidase
MGIGSKSSIIPRLRHAMSLTALTLIAAACDRGPESSIVPIPRSVTTSSGSFTLDATTGITLTDDSDDEARRVADMWATPFREQAGLPLPIGATGAIRLGVDGTGDSEGYRLEVDKDGVSVIGTDHAGLFYGLQTLSQLLPPGTEAGATGAGGAVEIHSVAIDDAPRFSYRGMHLDVARHFYGPDFVKRYLDHLARYKINRFHWHLTEDQGWRIEIEAYPRLTEISAYRNQTQIGHGSDEFNGDGQRYGGFYTKDEIRDIVAYAEARYITIIPEIEMPGHAQAALAAYPELA